MIPNPILKVLSTLSSHEVRHLLMGGQACVFYGAAEFSRDCDIAILVDDQNRSRLSAALTTLAAACRMFVYRTEYLAWICVLFASAWLWSQKSVCGNEPLELLFSRMDRNDAGEVVRLELPNQKMINADLSHVAQLVSLETLNLAFCRHITDEGVAHLKDLTRLKQLNLGGCKRVSDIGINQLSQLRDLEMLNLSVTQVSDASMKVIATFLKLRHLDFDNTNVSDAALAGLLPLKELAFLRLADTSVTDAGLVHLKPLPKLRALVLSGTAITDDGLTVIAEMKGLERLSLTGTSVTAAALKVLSHSKPMLRVTGP